MTARVDTPPRTGVDSVRTLFFFRRAIVGVREDCVTALPGARPMTAS